MLGGELGGTKVERKWRLFRMNTGKVEKVETLLIIWRNFFLEEKSYNKVANPSTFSTLLHYDWVFVPLSFHLSFHFSVFIGFEASWI